MKARWALGVGLSVLGASAAWGQMPDRPGGAAEPPVMAPAPSPAPASLLPQGCDGLCDPCCEPPRFYAGVDYLLWQLKSQPVPIPLVTTSNVNDSGIIGQPSTVILGGNSNLGYNWMSGVKVSAGYILDHDTGWAIDGNVFFILRKERRHDFLADDNGNPVLAVPFQDAQTGEERSLVYSIPGEFTGGISFSGGSRLSSGEVNLVMPISSSERFRIDWVMGTRYVDLSENIQISSFATVLPGAPGFTVGGVNVGPESTAGDVNDFHTRNQFFATQFGLRAEYAVADGLTVRVFGNVALGVNDQNIAVNGTTFVQPASGAPPTLFLGGLNAVATNIGRNDKNQFAFMPEAGIQLGYWMTDAIRLTAGWQFLYINRVVRPGDQLDRVINRSYVPQSSAFLGPAEPFRPLVPFKTTSFWAHGMSVGFEVRF
ncbi:MAG TPA: BBP7 family outer membrane beta-barrel protein [Gemmatales bacterium]|nr:BBP7 family outer membrane beta-barrel protein [Gemmatales bacterium]HMP58322.1 BBP7 family outer membrane beta-barrel protein [Gemmatales bacterium]